MILNTWNVSSWLKKSNDIKYMKYFWLIKKISDKELLFNNYFIILWGIRFLIFLKKCVQKQTKFTYFTYCLTEFLINISKIFLKFFAWPAGTYVTFPFLIFILNSSREAVSLYSDNSFIQRDGTLYVIVSIP